ncbi:MAG: GDSL-type esterase/lipase family protein [Actinomycetota bacterium]
MKLRTRGLTASLVLLVVAEVLVSPIAWGNSIYKAVLVLGQSNTTSETASALTMNEPSSVFVDGAGHILVADRNNHRVLIWDQLPTPSGTPPNRVLGQPDRVNVLSNQGGLVPGSATLSCPSSAWSDGQTVIVADRGNDRVLIYSDIWAPTTPTFAPNASVVVGKVSMSEGAGRGCSVPPTPVAAGNLLSAPYGVASDGLNLFVADTSNNRVLQWFSLPTTNGTSADKVLGQSSMTTRAATPVGASSMNAPRSVATDGARVLVADTLNNRILVFGTMPQPTDPNGKPADTVIGQPNMSASGINAGETFLYDRVYPSSRNLNHPGAVSHSNGKLLITDTDNHRVLVFSAIPVVNFVSADDEIGHGRFTSGTSKEGDYGLTLPSGAAMSADRILVADSGNNRVTVYISPLDSNGYAMVAQVDPAAPLRIVLNWPAVPGAKGYRLFRDGFWYDDLLGSSITSYIDSQLSPDSYTYYVKPLEYGVEGEGLAPVTATAPSPAVLPPLVVRPHASYSSYLAEGDSGSSMDTTTNPSTEIFDPWVKQIADYAFPVRGNLVAVSGSTCVGTDQRFALNRRIESDMQTYRPDLITIGIGTNDLRSGYANTNGSISMRGLSACLKDLIVKVAPDADRTLIFINAYHLTNWDLMHPQLYGEATDFPFSAGSSAKRDAWSKVIRDAALHGGVPVVDVHKAATDAIASGGDRVFFRDDNVHVNQWGHDVLGDAILGQLIKLIGNDPRPEAVPGHPAPHVNIVSSATALFNWRPPAMGATRYEAQWSTSASYVDSVSVFTDSTQLSVNFPTDAYWYFRIRRNHVGEAPGPWSLSTRVLIDRIAPTPPSPPSASPNPGSSTNITTTPLWTWGPSVEGGLFRYYQLCFGQNAGLLTCPNVQYTPVTSYQQGRARMGAWYFKVRGIDWAGNIGEWSGIGTWVSAGVV